jgi:hypothetical protein
VNKPVTKPPKVLKDFVKNQFWFRSADLLELLIIELQAAREFWQLSIV